jgi:hypothetical protein
MGTQMTIRQAIEAAGGILVVAQKLNYSHNTVMTWFYGSGHPGKAGNLRDRLAKLAGVSVSDVTWDRAALPAKIVPDLRSSGP